MAIRGYQNQWPQLGGRVYVDEAAVVIGRVQLADDVSVWPGAVLRGDVNEISIGACTNIQDGSVLHVSGPSAAKPAGSPLRLGEEVTVGHRVTLHGCTIADRVLVGMAAVVLDDALVESDVMIGAGSLVPPRKHLAGGWLYMGAPVKAIRLLTQAEKVFLRQSAKNYMETAAAYRLLR